jgi:hypothetical protein
MKLAKIYLAIALLGVVGVCNAQFNNGMNNQQTMGGGLNRQNQIPNQPDKPNELSVDEMADNVMEIMTPKLELDVLQQIAIRNEIKESYRQRALIFKDKESSQEKKLEEINVLNDMTKKKVISYLNPSQIEKYEAFEKEKRPDKKAKGKKKNKKEAKRESIDSNE